MELPQQRSFGAEGRKPTHDFLSLYGHSTVQPDPRTPSHGGGHLKTHDFLQPLERVEKATAKEETNLEVSTAEKPPPPAAPPPGSVEHILPGGIGTYSIGHISYYNHRGVPKPEGESMFTMAHQGSGDDRNEENSNCSSYTGSGFTLWEESTFKKGKTGKENFDERSTLVRETGSSKAAQWTTSERPSVSLTSNNHRNSFSSLSSSYRPILSGHKKQSFMEMIKSGKCSTQDDEFDEEEEFVLKRESPSPINKGELKVKVDGKNSEQKANTPRSKHSATEQRRRSKINDRFQMLREIIPHSDQKRDKASFLLEVIEYIQFLQVKVQKYEGSYQGWSNDPTSVPWRTSGGSAECYIDPSRGINGAASPALLFATKLEEKNISVSPTLPKISQTSLEPDTQRSMDHHHGITNKPLPFPLSLQPNLSNSGRSGGAVPQQPPRMLSDTENIATHPHSEFGNAVCDKMKEKELTIEGGTISISDVYSKGLLSTLTKALHSSGVDLSQASISVQIELGKRAHNQPSAPTSHLKDDNLRSYDQGTTRSRVPSMETNQALKKLKTVNS